MSKLPKIHLEHLPKRDAVARLRMAYACLEQGWQTHCRKVEQEAVKTTKEPREKKEESS
jgi:hypothetical protein